jgi:glycosyltransferase involved in cell wall biosynthesis
MKRPGREAASVLLTVSGKIDPERPGQVARGERPRADYLELGQAFGAELLDYTQARSAAGGLGRILERTGGPDLVLAWACFRRRSQYKVIFTDGEQVGIPLAALLKFLSWPGLRPRHLMLVHVLDVPKKMLFLDWLGVRSRIDTFFVYSSWQKRFIESRWRVPPEQVIWTPFMVDDCFFSVVALPCKTTPVEPPMICSVGLEFRDYPTLIEAVRGQAVQVVIAAASPWSKRSDTTTGQSIPDNVTVRRFNQYELRQVYADSRFLVMPLYSVNFQAGVTAILEAMAMGKAVICSQTPGQTDVVVHEKTGLYVPPGDAGALRAAIQYLLDHPDEAERMGQAGRRRIEEEMNLDHYVARLRGYITGIT